MSRPRINGNGAHEIERSGGIVHPFHEEQVVQSFNEAPFVPAPLRLDLDAAQEELLERDYVRRKAARSKAARLSATPINARPARTEEQPFVLRWRAALCRERRLAVGVRYVLLALSQWMDGDGYCWPSQRTLADRSGVPAR